jgi:hypothetical protein
MNSTKSNKTRKIQALLTNHLLKCGSIELLLPDGVSLEIGITKEGKHGLELADDYCFVKASREGNSTLLDTYNVGLQYVENERSVICLDASIDENGRQIKRLEIV